MKRTGGRKGRWEKTRRGKDEVRRVAEPRGIGGGEDLRRRNSFPGQIRDNNYVMAVLPN